MDTNIKDAVGYILMSLLFLPFTWLLTRIAELVTKKKYWDANAIRLVLYVSATFFLLGVWHLVKHLLRQ